MVFNGEPELMKSSHEQTKTGAGIYVFVYVEETYWFLENKNS